MGTAVSAAGSSTSSWQIQRSGHGAGMRKALNAAAEALGMSTDDLRTALKSGTSMSDLASTKGMSADDLTTAIATKLTSGTTTMTTDDATQLAQQVVAGPSGVGGRGGAGGPGGPGGPPPGGPPPGGPPPGAGRQTVSSAMDSVASALGLTSDELQDELSTGTNLGTVASNHGMDATKLQQTLTEALTKADPSLTGDQATKLAKQLMDGPPKPPDDSYTRVALNQSTGASSSANVSQQALRARYQEYQASSNASQVAQLVGANL